MGNFSMGAVLVALSGIVTVFLMLAILCLMIPIISKCVRMVQKQPAPAPAAPAPAAAAPTPSTPAGGAFSGEVALIDVDEKTAACIMAIVSHETGIPLSELIFHKIKAL